MTPSDHASQLFSSVANLTTAITNIKLYSKNHPMIQQHIVKACNSITKALADLPELTFILIGEEVVVNNAPLKGNTQVLLQFHRLLKEKGIERLTFLAGLTKSDLEKFISDLASPQNIPIQSQTCIRVGKVGLYTPENITVYGAADLPPLHQNDQSQIEILERLKQIPLENFQEFYFNIKRDKIVNVMEVDGIVKSFIKGFSHGLGALQMLGNLKHSNQYTFTHVINVCLLTMAQAEALGFSGHQLYDIGIAAVLHDVGKLFIPDDILNKPSVLTKQERTIIESHSLSGAQYILKLANVPQLAILGALEHHIRYNGTGYPFINSNWRPHLSSQMIAIADIYDAMRSRRPYQDPKSEEVVFNILKKEKGTSFNPYLVDNFLDLLQRTPRPDNQQHQSSNSPYQSHLDQKHSLLIAGS